MPSLPSHFQKTNPMKLYSKASGIISKTPRCTPITHLSFSRSICQCRINSQPFSSFSRFSSPSDAPPPPNNEANSEPSKDPSNHQNASPHINTRHAGEPISREKILHLLTTSHRHLLMQYGFSQYAIAQLLKELQYDSQMMHTLVTPLDLIEHIMTEANQKMALKFSNEEAFEGETNPQERLKMLIRYRLEMIKEYVREDRWHEAMALWLIPGSPNSWNRQYGRSKYASEFAQEMLREDKNFLPSWMNLLPGMEQISRALWHVAVLSDEMVHLMNLPELEKLKQQEQDPLLENIPDADITSPQWYTERASVALLYFSTELYMLTDVSENFEDSWDFLDRKVDDMSQIKNMNILPSTDHLQSLVQLVRNYVSSLGTSQRYPKYYASVDDMMTARRTQQRDHEQKETM